MYPIRKRSATGIYFICVKSLMICWLAISVITADGAQICNEYDFSPACGCTFSSSSNSYKIECGGLMSDVAAVFRTKPALNINYLSLYIRPEGDSIPADLLGQSRFYNAKPQGEQPYCELNIYGAYNGVNPWVTVDPNAFRSSERGENSSLTDLRISNLDTSRMDFQFLSDVRNNLQGIYFYSLFNMEKSLPTLPYLPSLTSLHFEGTSDMNKAFTSGNVLQCNGLTSLYVWSKSDAFINNEAITQMMNWLLPSSANTLDNIYVRGINMTRTPLQLASFTNLRSVTFNDNIGNLTIAAGTFLSNRIESIELSGILNSQEAMSYNGGGVVAVEEGAFQGNYSMTKSIYIPGNRQLGGLARFEAAAFKDLLEQMVNTRPLIGTVTLEYQADYAGLDCYTDPCQLAWICRDNRYLLTRLQYAQCKGTMETLENLSPFYFSECPITDCPSYCISKSLFH